MTENEPVEKCLKNKIFLIFAFKAFVAASPIMALWLFIIFCPLWYSDEEIPYFHWNKDYCAQSHDNDVIILGDSIANGAYLPDMLSEKTVNLSLGGQSPMESFYVLRDYLSHNKAPLVCYVSFMEMHFANADCLYTRTLFSRMLSLKDFLDMRGVQKSFSEQYQHFNYFGSDPVETQFLMMFSSPSIFIPSVKRAMFERPLPDGVSLRVDLCKLLYGLDTMHGGSYMSRKAWSHVDSQKVDAAFEVSPIQDFYYRRIIELCISKGIQVRLVKVPVNGTFWNYTSEYMKNFEAYYGKIRQDFPTVTVDWFDNYAGEYCFDTNHLNISGAVRFCKELASRYPLDFEDDGPVSDRTKGAVADYIALAEAFPETVAILKSRVGE